MRRGRGRSAGCDSAWPGLLQLADPIPCLALRPFVLCEILRRKYPSVIVQRRHLGSTDPIGSQRFDYVRPRRF
jgi:hypothetical protein